MADQHWTRLWELFHEALEQPLHMRGAFLERECDGDGALRQRLDDMLRSHEQATSFIEPPTRESVLRFAAAGRAPDSPPNIPRYRILRLLGEGGFAFVYLAEQLEPVQRQVALKVLRPGMDSTRILSRFAAERQALALLDHPGIARVFDAGMTDDGRPFFAIEYIDGRPITAYCDANNLSTRARLHLFTQMCEAVQHALHKGIIHRDLKPANVLVTDEPAEADGPKFVSCPTLKVIDFGVARAIGRPLSERTLFTEAGMLVGTPEYMSPEQAGGATASAEAEDIDTRADVYALGVLLYELLTGALPFEARDLRHAALDQMLRVIREQDPPRPSVRLTALGPCSAESAARRATDPRTLTRQITGDLDWIVMKALEKDRDRRYRTPSEFAADIERHLRDEPVAAGPPSVSYRMRKFVRRNRTAVAMMSVIFLALVAGVIATTSQAIRASRAEHEARQRADSEAALRRVADERTVEAERQTKIAQAVAQFVNRDILAAADPRNAARRDITLREAVDSAAEKVGERFADEPEVEASVRRVLGDTYRSLGALDAALPQIERARQLFTERLAGDDPRLLGTVNDLAILYVALGRFADAEPLHLQGIEMRRRMLGLEHRETIAATINLAVLYRGQGRVRDAERMLRECIDILTRAPGGDMEAAMLARQHLAGLCFDGKRFDEAEPLFRETYEHHRASKGEDHPYTLVSLGGLARVSQHLGRNDEAETMFKRLVESSQRRQGPEHSETAVDMAHLADFYRAVGRYDEAAALLTGALAITRQALGETHRTTLQITSLLGNVYDSQQRWSEAEPYYAQAANGARKQLGADHWLLGLFLLNHAKCLNRLERWADAEPLLVEAQKILLASLGPAHEHSIESFTALAYTYSKTDRIDLARDQHRLRAESRATTQPATQPAAQPATP